MIKMNDINIELLTTGIPISKLAEIFCNNGWGQKYFFYYAIYSAMGKLGTWYAKISINYILLLA